MLEGLSGQQSEGKDNRTISYISFWAQSQHRIRGIFGGVRQRSGHLRRGLFWIVAASLLPVHKGGQPGETRLVSVTHTGDTPFWTFWETHIGRAVASRACGSVDYGGASFIGTFAEVGWYTIQVTLLFSCCCAVLLRMTRFEVLRGFFPIHDWKRRFVLIIYIIIWPLGLEMPRSCTCLVAWSLVVAYQVTGVS